MPRPKAQVELMPDGTQAFRMQHGMLVDGLMHSMKVDPNLRNSFNARVRATIDHFYGVDTSRSRRRPNRRHRLIDALDIALAIQMQRGFVGERMSVQIVKENQFLVHDLWWQSLIKMDTFALQIPLDAFHPRGDRNTTASAAFHTEELHILSRLDAFDVRPLVTIGASAVAQNLVGSLIAIGAKKHDVEAGIDELGSVATQEMRQWLTNNPAPDERPENI